MAFPWEATVNHSCWPPNPGLNGWRFTLVFSNFVKPLQTFFNKHPQCPDSQVKSKIANSVRFAEFQISPEGGLP